MKERKKSDHAGSRSQIRRAFIYRAALVPLAVVALAIVAMLAGGRPATASAAQIRIEGISDTALDQIRSLIEEKASRTPSQRKIDSNILLASKKRRGEFLAANIESVQANVDIRKDGSLVVDIDATVTDELLAEIERTGGEVVNSFAEYGSIRARVPIEQVEPLAELPGIKFINRAAEFETHRVSDVELSETSSSRPGSHLSFAERAARLRPQLNAALAKFERKRKSNSGEFTPAVGTATSSGDVAHTTAAARLTYSVNGAGVKIGVISDSYNSQNQASSDVTSGDLPGPGNPNGFTTPVTVIQDASGSDEGRAMLQIVHDLAPGAQLYFATAIGGQAVFAANIQNLRNAGCDIIIDDILYLAESPFQDGIIAQAVNTVTANGALYFSSAGNSGNLNDTTSGVWEGNYVDGGPVGAPIGAGNGNVHSFGALTYNAVASGGSSRRVDLFWSDALGQSANDYDVYVLNSAGTSVRFFSNSFQDGNDDPYETTGSGNVPNVGDRIVIVKFLGATRYLHLSTGRGRLTFATAGHTRGHSCAANAFGVAAVNVATAGGGAFAGGPPNPVETFSSDGPRRVFYNADGSPITPGNFLATGGAVRQKPDIAAGDGVATTVTGFGIFFGTSAAAPHAGAVAALIKSFSPSLTASQIRTILTSTALDIEGVGVDRDSGAGIVMALSSLNSIAVVHTLTVASQNPNSGVNITVSPNDTGGQGNGVTQFTRTYNENTLVTLTAPATAGVNPFVKWQRDGVDYTTNQTASVLIDSSFTMTAVYNNGPDNAVFVSQSVPAQINPGQSQTVSVRMRNTGTTTWTSGDGYKLGSQNPQDNTTWGLNRVNLPSSVAPGAEVTFTFNITAPVIGGTYNFQWRMIKEGTGFFGGTSTNQAVLVGFYDVPPTHLFYTEINKLAANGITAGCGGGNYCPESSVTREQMAAFIIRALGTPNPPTPAMQRFADVPPSNIFYAFIEEMAVRGITTGCGGSNYCPAQPVLREQMAAFIIRALGEFNPPPPAMQRFQDVPPSNPFYAFIDRMAALQITLGCSQSPPLYCPADTVTRGQMAVFLVRAFGL